MTIAPTQRAEIAAGEAPARRFEIENHPVHHRLKHIRFDAVGLEAFFLRARGIGVQNLEYVPFMRFYLADLLEDCVGSGLGAALRQLVATRDSGGFTLGAQDLTRSLDDYVRLGTAVGHLLGPSNHDAMSGKYYARFSVNDTDDSDSYLRQAYRIFTLHTDGTFVEGAIDWLLMMKFAEENAVGGESRLMHLDDWSELERFSRDPLAEVPMRYKAPGSKNVDTVADRPVFFTGEHGLSVSFIDQFAQPRSRREARYLHDLSAAMEASTATLEVPLPVGDLVVLNNFFWLHGRAPFGKNPNLHRELMRLRGSFE